MDKLAFTVSGNSSRACGVWARWQAALPRRLCLPQPPPPLPLYPPFLPTTALAVSSRYNLLNCCRPQGSTEVGRIVMREAAERIVPVTLELVSVKGSSAACWPALFRAGSLCA